MAIVATEVESIHGSVNESRMIFFRCQDDQGEWHFYGPVVTNDPAYTPSDYFAEVAAKVSDALANAEFERVI